MAENEMMGPREFRLSAHADASLRVISVWQGGLILSAVGILWIGGLAWGTIAAVVVLSAIVRRLGRGKKSWRAGIRGETRVKTILRGQLGPDYAVFYNIPTGNGDIDCVVVGPTGVFALEIKEHRGQIFYTKASGWSQIKVGRGGTPYRGGLRNPSSQLLAGIRWLKGALREAGVDVWVDGIIVFTNPAVTLHVASDLRGVSAVKVENLAERLLMGKPLTLAIRGQIEERLLSGVIPRGGEGSNTADTAPQNGAHAFSRCLSLSSTTPSTKNREVSIS